MPESHDPRVNDAIAAFLDGPARTAAIPAVPPAPVTAPAPPPATPAAARRLADPALVARRGQVRPGGPPAIDSRADWNVALHLEDSRFERYGRPVAVVVIDALPYDRSGRQPARSMVDGLAAQLARVLRGTMRETDRLTRVTANRFQVLLPETTFDAACQYAERAQIDGEREATRGTLGLWLRAAVGTPGRGVSLVGALTRAEGELER